MMARTRADVDALNDRARAALVARVADRRAGEPPRRRDWQAGDLLRARRNDRRLQIGDGHVRNGDRYRVLDAQGPGGGLIVEDLDGRDRAVLPPEYVAAHAEYGWAATIDAAQGATTDVGIVLVRPGLDREHLYVGMTRGREANHAYIAPDLTVRSGPPRPGAASLRCRGPDHRGTRPRRPGHRARDQRGAGRRPHRPRPRRRNSPRRPPSRPAAPRNARKPPAARPDAPKPSPRRPEHAATIALLAQRRGEHEHLRGEQKQHVQRVHELRVEYAELPRFAPRRRPVLLDLIHHHETASAQALPVLDRLGVEIQDPDPPGRGRHPDPRGPGQPRGHPAPRPRRAPAASSRTRPAPTRRPRDPGPPAAARRGPRPDRTRSRHHTRSHEHTHGRDRDDGRGISM